MELVRKNQAIYDTKTLEGFDILAAYTEPIDFIFGSIIEPTDPKENQAERGHQILFMNMVNSCCVVGCISRGR